MDGNKIKSLGAFDVLFNKSVPHILEKIFSLDYDSFVSCGKVCKTWNYLLSSESYHARSEEMLLKKQKNDEDLCYHSSYGGRSKIDEIKDLISSGVDPNCKRGTPLYYATSNGNAEVVKILLDGGAEPNLANSQGITPLYSAASWHSTSFDMVKQLLHAGALPNVPNKSGVTPLGRAVLFEYDINVVKLLLDSGAEPNMTNHQGGTPLHTAALWETDNTEVVKLLLDAGADPNKVNDDGLTPLQVALSRGNLDVVRLFHGAGAPMTASDH